MCGDCFHVILAGQRVYTLRCFVNSLLGTVHYVGVRRDMIVTGTLMR